MILYDALFRMIQFVTWATLTGVMPMLPYFMAPDLVLGTEIQRIGAFEMYKSGLRGLPSDLQRMIVKRLNMVLVWWCVVFAFGRMI